MNLIDATMAMLRSLATGRDQLVVVGQGRGSRPAL